MSCIFARIKAEISRLQSLSTHKALNEKYQASNLSEKFDLSVSEDLNHGNSNLEWSENSEEGFNCRERDLDVPNSNLSKTRVCHVEEKGNDSIVESTLAKECTQMTPIQLNATYEEVDYENEVNLEEHSEDVNVQAKVEE